MIKSARSNSLTKQRYLHLFIDRRYYCETSASTGIVLILPQRKYFTTFRCFFKVFFVKLTCHLNPYVVRFINCR